MAEYRVVLFHSTAHALRAEKVLERAGFKIKMIPTPRQISSDCGMALRFDPADEEKVAATLKEYGVPTNGIHAI
jgi:N-acyl-L-homoserine lactone synthetase